MSWRVLPPPDGETEEDENGGDWRVETLVTSQGGPPSSSPIELDVLAQVNRPNVYEVRACAVAIFESSVYGNKTSRSHDVRLEKITLRDDGSWSSK